MPLRPDLLTPIAGDNPAGANLRYELVYGQIKEARTETDETLPAGDWDREIKRADFNLVVKLAGDALASKSKDLQLAAWLGEALLRQEGISLLSPVLQLFLELQQAFWESLYPEIDEGDLGLRVAPLEWAANRYAPIVYAAGLTASGIGFFEYKAARTAGREEEVGDSEQRRSLRHQHIDEGKSTSEEVDKAIAATPKSFYVELEQELRLSREALRELETFCDEHYVEDGPSFRKLRDAIEEVQNLVSSLLREKRKLEPDVIEDTSGIAIESHTGVSGEKDHGELAPVLNQQELQSEEPPQASAISIQPDRLSATAGEVVTPENWDDALSRIESAAGYMYGEDPSSPLPFMVRSSMRVSELRVIFDDLRYQDLVAPTTEIRQSIKGAVNVGEWMEVHRQSFEALGSPCGCGWLDLYRYLWTSCREVGWQAQQRSIASVVSQILREMPELLRWTLNDDTPVANADTLRWLAEEIAPPSALAGKDDMESATVPDPYPKPVVLPEAKIERSDTTDEEDLYATAQALVAKGQIQDAIQMLARDAAHQPVGRLRYSRSLQIAELCVQSGNQAVAVPVLQGLVREVEKRELESWEPCATVARPYALLLECAPMARLDTQAIFARLCAIDPCAALTVTPPVES